MNFFRTRITTTTPQSQASWGRLYKSTLFMSLQLGSPQSNIIHELFSVLAITCCILHGEIGLMVIMGIMQMGSNMKKSIFDEQTSKALKKWHMAVKKKQVAKGDKSIRTLGNASPRSSVGSPLHPSIGPTLHRFKTTGHSTRFNGYDDLEASDLENDPTTPIIRAEEHSTAHVTDHDDTELQVHVPQNEESSGNEDDFSFAKPAPKR